MTSDRPTFDTPKLKVSSFKLDSGADHPILECSLNDRVQFPIRHPSVNKQAWAEEGDGSYADSTKWFPHKVKNLDDCYRAHQLFKFPIELKHRAESNAKKLYDAIVELGAPKLLRNQTSGKFDTRKSGKLWVDLHRGVFDLETTRPFMNRVKTNPKRPHVAVLACGGWQELHSNGPEYIPDMSIAMMSIVWACQAIDCHVTSALCRNVLSMPGKSKVLGVVTISSPEVCPSLGDFSGLLHTNMYRLGGSAMYCSHPDSIKLNGQSDVSECADSACPAVQWARNHKEATFVIAVGKQFTDSSKADMVINYNEVRDIDKLIDKIASKIYNQRMERSLQSVAV